MHNTNDTAGPLAFEVEDGGRLLGIGRTKTWELVRTGEIPTIWIGRRRLITRSALEAYVRGREQAGTGPS